MSFKGNLILPKGSTISAAMASGSLLYITGQSYLSGNMNVAKDCYLENINATRLTAITLRVSGTTTVQNLNEMYATITSSLTISGPATFQSIRAGDLRVTGDIITSNINVSSASFLNGSVTTRSSLNVSGPTLLQNVVTGLSSFVVSGTTNLRQITGLSSLNVSGNTNLNSDLIVIGTSTLENVTAMSSLNISGRSTLNGTTLLSGLNVSGTATMAGVIVTSDLDVSDESTLGGASTISSTLNVSGQTRLLGPSSFGSINLPNTLVIQGASQIISTMNVSGVSIIGSMVASRLNISGVTVFNSATTLSTMNVSGDSILNGSVTIGSSLNELDQSIFNSVTNRSSLNVLSNSLLNSVTIGSTLNVSGQSLMNQMTNMSSLNISNISIINVLKPNNFNVSGLSTIVDNVTSTKTLNVSGSSILVGNVTVLSNLNVSGQSRFINPVNFNSLTANGAMTLVSTLNVDGTTNLGPTTIVGNMSISGPTVIRSNVSMISTLNVDDTIRTNAVKSLSDLTTNANDATQTLNLNGFVINIGSENSIVNIMGTTTSIVTTDMVIENPLYELNDNPTVGFVNGNDSGININGISGVGYLKTDATGGKYVIKGPRNANIDYVLTKNDNEGVSVSGVSVLYRGLTSLSTLNSSGITRLLGQTNINNSLNVVGVTSVPMMTIDNMNVSGVSIFKNSVTFNNVNMSGLTVLQNNVSANQVTVGSKLNISGNSSVLSSNIIILNVSGTSLLTKNTTAETLDVSGKTTIRNGTLESSLNVSGNTTLIGAVTVGSTLSSGNMTVLGAITTPDLNITDNVVLRGRVTELSNLTVSDSATLFGATSLMSTLNVSGTTIANGLILNSSLTNNDTSSLLNTTIRSSLTVSNDTSLQGNTTISSTLNVSGSSTLGLLTTSNPVLQSAAFNSVNVSGNTTFRNDLVVNSLNVLNTSVFNNSVSVGDSINISGNSLLRGGVTLSDLNVSGQTTLPNMNVGSLNVTGLIKLQNQANVVNVNAESAVLQGAVTITSNLNSSGTFNLAGATTVASSLNIGDATFSNAVTAASLSVGDMNANTLLSSDAVPTSNNNVINLSYVQNNYQTVTTVSTTYLTQNAAAVSYLTVTGASSTYVTNNTYLPKTGGNVTGNIGINKIGPTAQIHISNNATAAATLTRIDNTGSGSGTIMLTNDAGRNGTITFTSNGASPANAIIMKTTTGGVTIDSGGNVGFGTASSSLCSVINPTSTPMRHLTLSGQEYCDANNSGTGVDLILNVNRGTNKQLLIADNDSAKNSTNFGIRLSVGSNWGNGIIDSVTTDGVILKQLGLGHTAGTVICAGGPLSIGISSSSYPLSVSGATVLGSSTDNMTMSYVSGEGKIQTTNNLQLNPSGGNVYIGINSSVSESFVIKEAVRIINTTPNTGCMKIIAFAANSNNYIQSGLNSATGSLAPLLFTNVGRGTEYGRINNDGVFKFYYGQKFQGITTIDQLNMSGYVSATGFDAGIQCEPTSPPIINFHMNYRGNISTGLGGSFRCDQRVSTDATCPALQVLVKNSGVDKFYMSMAQNGSLAIGTNHISTYPLSVSGNGGGLAQSGYYFMSSGGLASYRLVWNNVNYQFLMNSSTTTAPSNIVTSVSPNAYTLTAGTYSFSATIRNDSNDWNLVSIYNSVDGSNIATIAASTQPWTTTGPYTGTFTINAQTNVAVKYSNNYYAYSSMVDMTITRVVSIGYTGSFGLVTAYFSNDLIVGGSVATISDERVKSNIMPVDGLLDKIKNIELVSYDYVDKLNNPEKCSIGVIAQQVKDVVGDSISLLKDFIPNIMQLAISITDPDTGILTLVLEKPCNLVEGDIVKIIQKKEHRLKVSNINNNSFDVEKWDDFTDEPIFVYGKEVEDFHTVDKPQLGLLALGGVKELLKLIKELEQENNELLEETEHMITNVISMTDDLLAY